MAETGQADRRPLSPHLQIYRPMLTMMMSIIHRGTGVILYFGTVLLAWWLVAAASGPQYFDYVNGLFASWFGRLVLLGYTWALIHHMLGGIRHLFWDTGRGFELGTVEWTARCIPIASVILTLVVWAIGYGLRRRHEASNTIENRARPELGERGHRSLLDAADDRNCEPAAGHRVHNCDRYAGGR